MLAYKNDVDQRQLTPIMPRQDRGLFLAGCQHLAPESAP